MNAPMYPLAVHNAVTSPTTASGPARPAAFCSSRIAPVMMSAAPPGTSALMLSTRVAVADGPSMASSEVSTMMAGNRESTP